MNIGFIGTGLMGSRIAARMLAAGHHVTVYNRTKEKALPLREKGALLAETPAMAAQSNEMVFTILTDALAVEHAALGPGGFLNSMQPKSVWVNISTIGPSAARRCADLASRQGLSYADAPVSGSTGPAERGELISLVGSSESVLMRIRPLLDTYSKQIIHAGDVGAGSSLKLVVNLMLGHSMAAFGETLAVGAELGLDRKVLLDTLIGGSVTAPFVTFKRNKLETHEYPAEFPLRRKRNINQHSNLS
jgi:3-hydroxyisobutyrate dehydrogenase/glyoxylate/succinic semialdehyde reductase